MLASAVAGDKVIRPLSFASPNSVIAASLAMMIVLMELVRIAADTRDLWLSPFLNQRVTFWDFPGFPVVLTQIQVINALAMGAVVLVAAYSLGRSRQGRNWRAVADDPFAAALLGVNAGRVVVLAGLTTAAFSAVAGIMATAYYGSMDFGAGLMFGLKVVMIAAIGDQSSPARCAAGAALFGLAETLWGAYMPFLWRDFAMFFSLLVILAVAVRRESRRPLMLLRPAPKRSVIGILGADPAARRPVGEMLLLPEGRGRLEIIHDEIRRIERGLAMRRGRQYQDDIAARRNLAEAVDGGEAADRPALHGDAAYAGDLRLRHAGIVFELEGSEPSALVAAEPGEGDDGADIAATFGQSRRLGGEVEILRLDTDDGFDGRHVNRPSSAGRCRFRGHLRACRNGRHVPGRAPRGSRGHARARLHIPRPAS